MYLKALFVSFKCTAYSHTTVGNRMLNAPCNNIECTWLFDLQVIHYYAASVGGHLIHINRKLICLVRMDKMCLV